MSLLFGDCVLDPEARQLRRAGMPVHLPPKTYRLLEILLAERPRVVSKSELDEILWPKSYVARSSLGRLVSELREALGDDAHEPRIIRTVHGVGYAFGAEVTPTGRPRTRRTRVALILGERRIELGDGEHVLGRGSECEVIIDAPGVSRRHARVRVEGAGASIVDLGSKNGTWVNRHRIADVTPLGTADEIAVGDVVLVVQLAGNEQETRTVYRP